MNLLARFEGVAEMLFTGAFKKNAARLQPVEIAKELAKAMFKNKQVSISQVYVPNVYRVFLHADDWGPLASFGDTFLRELSKYLYAEGRRAGYTFLTKPVVELHSDDTVKPREMFVEVDFDDSVTANWTDDEVTGYGGEEEEYERESAEERDAAPLNFTSAPAEGRNYEYGLEVMEGPDKPLTYVLGKREFYVGRHNQCEVVLHDPQVSRRHLKITETDRGWIADDLGSTNGTMVNGQRITREVIAPGDKIQLGQTVLVIKRLSGD